MFVITTVKAKADCGRPPKLRHIARWHCNCNFVLSFHLLHINERLRVHRATSESTIKWNPHYVECAHQCVRAYVSFVRSLKTQIESDRDLLNIILMLFLSSSTIMCRHKSFELAGRVRMSVFVGLCGECDCDRIHFRLPTSKKTALKLFHVRIARRDRFHEGENIGMIAAWLWPKMGRMNCLIFINYFPIDRSKSKRRPAKLKKMSHESIKFATRFN